MQQAPPVIAVEQGRSTVFVGLGLAAALAGAAALYLFDPSQHGFYPRCFFKMASGLDCPGCGGLRATHQLLHGDIRAAFGLNPLFIAVLPIGAFFAVRTVVERLTQRKWPRLLSTTAMIWIAAAGVIGFGFLRNLPWRAWIGS
jgi:hypothetical protein